MRRYIHGPCEHDLPVTFPGLRAEELSLDYSTGAICRALSPGLISEQHQSPRARPVLNLARTTFHSLGIFILLQWRFRTFVGDHVLQYLYPLKKKLPACETNGPIET